MIITSNRVGELTLPYVVVEDINSTELSHKKRALAGNVFVNYYGVDEEYTIKSRIALKDEKGKKNDDFIKLKSFMGDVVEIREAEHLDDGEYFMEKLKVKEFSLLRVKDFPSAKIEEFPFPLERQWYHVEFTLKKYFTGK